ncbi:MAG: WcaI family glycosyltransferase [Cytophaga sp.]|uniref:WcaI family glycosyltransferase n=1 Tax=Cytophaga sp. TaxID=29535 RepID=UPI003F800438
MRILIHGINYSPDLTGIGKYTGEMGAWLVKKGHEVDVITAMPYYPQWKKNPAYAGKWWFTEKIAGANVKRCPLYVPTHVKGATRMIHEFSFFLSSFIYWFRALFKSYDLVFTPYPPLIIGFWPYIYKLFHPKAKWVFHIQDLQVDAARELDLIKSKRLLRILTKLEAFWLKKADYVSSISSGMKTRILEKGVAESKYIMLPNWAETNVVIPIAKERSMREELDIPCDKKVVLYSGNVGEKQGVDLIIDAAVSFKHMKNVLFVIAGEGASKERLKRHAAEKGGTNVLFISLQPYDKLASFLAIADVHLVVQKKTAADLVLPSKFISILSAGGIALVTADEGTTLYNMVKTNQIAHVCEPENVDVFVHTLESIITTDNSDIAQRARGYAEKNLSIDAILNEFTSRVS